MTETIRVGEIRDVGELAEFNLAMALETEGKQLDRAAVTAGVRGLIKNPNMGFYMVAEQQRRLIAGLMVTYEWSDWRNGCFWWIQSVYVLPSHRRHGVFKRLLQEVRSLATSRADVCGLRLYVEQNNAIAQATYRNLGMTETHYDMYELELNST